MNDPLQGWVGILTGKHVNVTDQVDGPQEGVVLSVDTGSNTVYVTMDNSVFGVNNKFGPMPYCRCDPVYAPQIGDHALVCFIGKGIDRPRLISWWEA